MTSIGIVMSVLGLIGITVGLIAKDEDADIGRTRFTMGGVCLALGIATLAIMTESDLPGFSALPGLALLLSSGLVLRHIQASEEERPAIRGARHPRPVLGAPTRLDEVRKLRDHDKRA